ncbi:MAG: hypothetical protein JNK82_29025 [Myxococcaceae bacterium]|nr:hypothetical protein [Myxococcaceae bacterium]
MPNRRNWAVVASVALHHAVLVWLWARDFPRYGTDGANFKQIAIELAERGRFLAPTFFEAIPRSNEFLAVYPPFYPYLNAAVFAVFGRSFGVGLAFDLTLHAALVTVLVVVVHRCGAPHWATALLPLGLFHLLDPFGRLETLATLLTVVALILLLGGPRARWAAFGVLGLAAATNPFVAFAGAVIGAGFLFARNERFTALLAAQGLTAPTVMVALWWPLLPGSLPPLLDQLKAHRALTGDASVAAIFRQAPMLFVSLALLTVAVAALRPANPRDGKLAPETSKLVRSLVVTVPLSIVVFQLGYRFSYHYRALVFVVAAAAVIHVAGVQPRWKQAVLLGALGVGALGNGAIAFRNVLAAAAREPALPRYGEILRRVDAAVPTTASVASLGDLWGINLTHPHFVDVHHSSTFPDYVVSSTWSDPVGVLQSPSYAREISAHYEELHGVAEAYEPGCKLHLGPLKVPVARGTCGWNVRIWRRRPGTSTLPP